MNSKICYPEFFYRANNKSDTAGFDKYVFHSHSIGDWFVYRNTRTGSKIRVKANKLGDVYTIPEKYFWDGVKDKHKQSRKKEYFRKPVDFFVWYTREYHPPYNKQFTFELNRIQEKYPEYFI
jgi:hypothetical protein